MGACFSKPEPNRHFGQLARSPPPDFTSQPGTSKHRRSARPAQPAYELLVDDEPPAYADYSSIISLKAINIDANAFGCHGIKSSYDVLNQRHFDIWLDSSHNVAEVTQQAMLLLAYNILGLAQAKKSNTTFYFTSLPNKTSPELTKINQGKLKALSLLWKSHNWPDAVELISKHETLYDLGLDTWIANDDNFVDGDSDGDKHVKLLNYVRQTMIPFWYGWHAKDLTMSKLELLYHTAFKASEKQPKSLNSVRITYERSIDRYRRNFVNLKDDSSKEVSPTTIMLLVASPLQPSEVKAIENSLDKGEKLLKDVKRSPAVSGSPFKISTLLFTGYLSYDVIQGFKGIDDYSQRDDICSLLKLDESRFLKSFMSPTALFKFYNSHILDVDQMKLRSDDVYSNHALIGSSDKRIVALSVEQHKEILGIKEIPRRVIEDSDDENDTVNPPQQHRLEGVEVQPVRDPMKNHPYDGAGP
ncbi:hypothetical protein JX265_014044 [Neoarthrinium moseri]|uniref:Uncharacterized protein n=1 Tax=Neoarthrinium moseri TaxID=1658444 RepID=A0A9Q0AHY3_9PEZI|nr:hypothetical protein JX265_014044 [Neoarthrinium moseri]